jgi:hypothetical protein
MKKIILVFILSAVTSAIFCQDKNTAPCIIKTGIRYISGDTLKADIYLPSSYNGKQNPILVFVDGFGGDFRDDEHYTGWAKFAASQGFVCVTYSARTDYVKPAFEKLLDFLYSKNNEYLLDLNRLSVYAASGHVWQGLPLINGDKRVKAALVFYGAAEINSFRLDMPVLLVRAGLDNTQLNKQLDSLAFKALGANAPYTITSLNTELHAFEDFTDTVTCLPFLANALNFLQNSTTLQAQTHFKQHEQEAIAARETYYAHWQNAFKSYTGVLLQHPGNDEAERQLGNICMELKEYAKALTYYDSALAHGNWRKGEIARQRIYAYAKVGNTNAAVEDMRLLKRIGWFKETDYTGLDEYKNIIQSAAYKKFINGQ